MEATEAHTAQGQDQELALQIKALKAANKVINHSIFHTYAKQNLQCSSSLACSDLSTHAVKEAVSNHILHCRSSHHRPVNRVKCLHSAVLLCTAMSLTELATHTGGSQQG